MLQATVSDSILQGEVACPMCAGWERSMKDVQLPRSPEGAGSADKASIVHPPDLTWLDEL